MGHLTLVLAVQPVVSLMLQQRMCPAQPVLVLLMAQEHPANCR